MKLLTTSAMALALLANTAAAEGELVLYHWFEYMPAELLEKFTA
ncbi:MAG: ABC transporter substrate-binding protein, partial [Sulfitobacter sp.]|nr:ABC transporter substrate-binding protein [Sulfitobacter sp.]